jgi:hypothetical protein
MARFKEQLDVGLGEKKENGVSIRNADEDGIKIKENLNPRNGVYLYYVEIPSFIIKLDKIYQAQVKRCNLTGEKPLPGNRPRARELSVIRAKYKNVVDKEAKGDV